VGRERLEVANGIGEAAFLWPLIPLCPVLKGGQEAECVGLWVEDNAVGRVVLSDVVSNEPDAICVGFVRVDAGVKRARPHKMPLRPFAQMRRKARYIRVHESPDARFGIHVILDG